MLNPGRMGISANEEADIAAKLSLSLKEASFKLLVPCADLKPLVTTGTVAYWF